MIYFFLKSKNGKIFRVFDRDLSWLVLKKCRHLHSSDPSPLESGNVCNWIPPPPLKIADVLCGRPLRPFEKLDCWRFRGLLQILEYFLILFFSTQEWMDSIFVIHVYRCLSIFYMFIHSRACSRKLTTSKVVHLCLVLL